jgi:hypothetical protein
MGSQGQPVAEHRSALVLAVAQFLTKGHDRKYKLMLIESAG